MGTKTKTGKQRQDKYYRLAKDHGFRARSAFKLIQINKTYNILSGIHTAVDLCAAPGSWLQVLSKAMLPPSKIIGVDLESIKPIHGVRTIKGDITEQVTQEEILRAADCTEIDLVLHDGAPNVGAAWDRDAYVQNELVCHAAKLACHLLRKNGTFVTKVFRSKDYNSILWVCNQLFAECLVTKPRSSREESAEVFLVCRGYKKPESIDARFFDPQFIFAEKKEQEEKKDPKLSEVLLEQEISIDKCAMVHIDCMQEMVDEETRILLSDLLVVDDADKKRLKRTLKKIQTAYVKKRGGNAPERIMDMRTPAQREHDELLLAQKLIQRREKITQRKILAKRTKRLGLSIEDVQEIERIHGDFFEDDIFEQASGESDDASDHKSSDTSHKESAAEEENSGEEQASDASGDSEPSSASSDLDMEDKVLGYRLREDEEEFEDDMIDRYVFDDEPGLPQFFKDDEEKYNKRYVYNTDKEFLEGRIEPVPRISKKKEELRARRLKRVERQMGKLKSRLGENEEVDLRSARKSALKKENREKKKLIFVGPSKKIPRIKGRIKATDRRMKKDKAGLKRAEERKKHKKRK